MRLFTSGFELNSLTANMEFNAVNGFAIATSPVRTGTYSGKVTLLSANYRGVSYAWTGSTTNGPLFFRFFINLTTLPTAENRIFVLNSATDPSTTPIVWITIDNTGVLRFYDEDGQIGSASSALSTGASWYMVEVEYNRTGSAGAHILKARLGGVEFAAATNRSLSVAVGRFHVGGNLNKESQSTGEWYFDDLALNDSTGNYQNTYAGNGRVIHLKPSGAGANSDWTNDYSYVDEVTPNDATDIVASNTLNQIDDHAIENTPAGLQSHHRINFVGPSVRFNGAGASANASFVLRLTVGANTDETPAITPANTTYSTNQAAVPKNHPVLANDSNFEVPGTSRRYTKADLDAAQGGYRLSAISTNNAQISTFWLVVEYDDTLLFDPTRGSLAFGEQTPTNSEVPVSYQTFSNGAGSVPAISGDADWGKLSLPSGSEGRSQVYDFGDSSTRQFTLTRDLYGTGSGSVTLKYRTSNTLFTQDAGSPSWTTYTGPTTITTRYLQIEAVGA